MIASFANQEPWLVKRCQKFTKGRQTIVLYRDSCFEGEHGTYDYHDENPDFYFEQETLIETGWESKSWRLFGEEEFSKFKEVGNNIYEVPTFNPFIFEDMIESAGLEMDEQFNSWIVWGPGTKRLIEVQHVPYFKEVFLSVFDMVIAAYNEKAFYICEPKQLENGLDEMTVVDEFQFMNHVKKHLNQVIKFS